MSAAIRTWSDLIYESIGAPTLIDSGIRALRMGQLINFNTAIARRMPTLIDRFIPLAPEMTDALLERLPALDLREGDVLTCDDGAVTGFWREL